jgi:hypothetical protein
VVPRVGSAGPEYTREIVDVMTLTTNLSLLGVAAGIGCGAIWYRKKKRKLHEWRESLDDVVEAHAEYLRLKHPSDHAKFVKLRRSDCEAATGEAVLFSLMKVYFCANPEPADHPGTGGTDIICHKHREDFVVEVTSLRDETVERRSGIPAVVDEAAGGAFQMVTEALFRKARSKATQMSGHPHARVLAITSTHFGASMVLGTMAAEWLLTSEPRIQLPIGAPGAPATMTTDLRRSVFFHADEHRNIVAQRQSISAILLVGVFGNEANVVGILHPESAYPFNVALLPGVPFVRIKNWPIVGGIVNTEWVVVHPEPKVFPHAAVSVR